MDHPVKRPSSENVERMLAAAAKVRELVPLSEHDVEAMAAEFDALRKGRQLAGAARHDSTPAIDLIEVIRDTKP